MIVEVIMFYVYAYLDPRKPGTFIYKNIAFDYEPFYIGKGTGNRLSVHLIEKSSGNRHKYNKIQSIRKTGAEPLVLKLKENLSEEEAWDYECSLVESIGRSVLGTGPLTNLKDGGEGGFTHINRIGLKAFLINKYGQEEGLIRFMEITSARTEKLKGQKRSDEQIKRFRTSQAKRYLEQPESKSKISESVKAYYETRDNPRKGKTHTEDAKRKNSLAHMGKRTGENNHNYKKSMRDRLIEKYGPEEGEIRHQAYIKKQAEITAARWQNPDFVSKMKSQREIKKLSTNLKEKE